MFRKNVADEMKSAAESLRDAGVDANFLLFLEYTDALKYVADHAQGKVLVMDSGAGAATKVVQGVLSRRLICRCRPQPGLPLAERVPPGFSLLQLA